MIKNGFWMMLLCCAMQVQAFDVIDYDQLFPAVVQGHHGNNNSSCNAQDTSSLTVYNSARINGTQGAALDYCTINAWSPTDVCDDGNGGRMRCQIAGQTIDGLNLNTNENRFKTSSSWDSVSSCTALTQNSATQDVFGVISIYSGCAASFSNAHSEYFVKSMALGNNATVTMAPGDYWIETLALNQGARLVFEGDSRLFVMNEAQLTGATMDVASGGRLTVVAYGSLSLNSGSVINGWVYADDRVNLNNQGQINGRVTSRHLTMNTSTQINDTSYGPAQPTLGCFTDDFSSSAISDNWAIKVLGASRAPSIVGNRLRLTSAINNQAIASTYQRLFPADSNLVTVEFDFYAWSPQRGVGGDGMAVILSDASVTPQPGNPGGSLGYGQYRADIPGFAGGWLGIGLDEYGNFSNPVGIQSGGPGRRIQSVAIRGSDAGGYRYLLGTAANLRPNIDVRGTSRAGPGHRYRITVDSRTAGQSMVTVERDTNDGNGYQQLIAPFNALSYTGQSPMPANFYLSLTASTGGANNNHEIDNFKVCALTSTPVGEQVHHFEFDYSSAPFTCRAEPVTLRACKNASCSELFTGSVTANLSPATVPQGRWLPGSSVTFSGGSTQLQLQKHDLLPVTLGVSSSLPATRPGSDTLCRRGSGAPSIAACTLSFADSGFFFDVPDKLANKPHSQLLIRAMKSDGSAQCVPAFANTNKTLSFWGEHLSTVTGNPLMALKASTSATWRDIGTTENTATPLPLAFDAQGRAQVDVNYPDAGKVELNAKYTGSTAGNDSGLVMRGADAFVSFPLGFCVQTTDYCNTADANCAAFRRAGDTFPLTITARAWQSGNSNLCANPLTPSYQQANMTLTHHLRAPAGGVSGSLGVSSYAHQLQQNSSNNVIQQSVSEVGVFDFGVQAPLPYLGSSAYPSLVGSSANLGPSGRSEQAIGRFVPAYVRLDSSQLTPACGGFSYMDQPFNLAYSLSALNLNRQLTRNYQGAFAKAVTGYQAADGGNGVPLDLRVVGNGPAGADWHGGQALFSGSASFQRPAAPAVDGPFPQWMLGLSLSDPDNMTTLLNPDMRSNGQNCQLANNCNALSLGTQIMRQGRVWLDNTYGPDNRVLTMQGQTQYWNGSNWQVNNEDFCTVVTPALAQQTDDLALGYQFEPALGSGQRIDRNGGAISSGEFPLLWQAVGGYRGKVTAPLSVPAWLQWYWQWNGMNTELQNPRASAYFGRYRGQDRIINWREVR
ncbi:DUF6701 domain-containing protein [Shewanella sp. YIC-542]|uniref:DUF6701 domain-containing protein n=1 Tax=Shewanella mytili TaxID=3377111 RepID=UPI00398E8FA5